MTAATIVVVAVLLCAVYAAAWPLLGHVDNRLEADMTSEPRSFFAEQVQHWLGIDHIHQQLHGMEHTMAKVIDLLNGLAAQEQAASAAQATSFHNIDAAFAKLQQAIADGDASPEVQAAADQLAAGFASLQKAAEDEGNLYAPADQPPADNGGDAPDQPQS